MLGLSHIKGQEVRKTPAHVVQPYATTRSDARTGCGQTEVFEEFTSGRTRHGREEEQLDEVERAGRESEG